MKHLLIAAHPGHELLLWQWLRNERPQVVVLTNGAGSNGVPRLDLTIDNLERAGASWVSQVVAPVPDAAIYQGLLDGDTGLFTQWIEALTAHVIAEGIECIVADEAEDYNPSHDLCRILANQVAIQAKARGHSVLAYGYPTVGHPSLLTRLAAEEHVVVELDVEAWRSKLDDMHRYARHFGGQLQRELDDFVAEFGAEAYSKECLFVARPTRYEQAETPSHKPFFERVGEERVAAGTYKHVIRGAHLQVVADRLRDHASLMRR
ncbi:hypothetical protein ACVC7V_21255 [Hydrogenophaga sp. A37]|uniref:hypothetical protein n=1 Tax=Hydrogenophaga sp. A37 TaxID=1945864 RepID=UPI000984E95F|nr:hypothetical protein [Hydrogenophaga sp. A37]OOG81552.1 hypothetical protein B0E41_17495 [Hydrogenophaga sp. A37]